MGYMLKNQKGLTPYEIWQKTKVLCKRVSMLILFIGKKNHWVKFRTGLTLIEIIVSAILLTMAAAASYTVFLSISSLGSLSRDELEANTEIGGWIERARTGATPQTTYQALPITGTGDANWVGLDTATSILQTFYRTAGNADRWPLDTKTGVTPQTLTAGYQINSISFDSNPSYAFRRVDLRVQWTEKR